MGDSMTAFSGPGPRVVILLGSRSDLEHRDAIARGLDGAGGRDGPGDAEGAPRAGADDRDRPGAGPAHRGGRHFLPSTSRFQSSAQLSSWRFISARSMR